MKKYVLALICMLFLTSNQLWGQNLQKNVPIEDKYITEDKEKAKEKETLVSLASDAFLKNTITGGLHMNKVMIFGGTHDHLYGYTDHRYSGFDKGDYCKTDAYWGGLEFYLADFSTQHPKLADIKFGCNINFYFQKEYQQRTLYSVPAFYIDEEIVPPDTASISKFAFIPGFFIGIDKKWFEIDAGISIYLRGYDEKSREYIDRENSTLTNKVYKKVDGRGYVWGDSSVKMNYLLRLGLENNAHFILSAYREDYNPDYGVMQIKLVFPVVSFFQLGVGGYLLKTQSIFIEPAFTLFGVTLGAKAGSIINYHNDNFKKVGIKDSLFYSAFISYGWN